MLLTLTKMYAVVFASASLLSFSYAQLAENPMCSRIEVASNYVETSVNMLIMTRCPCIRDMLSPTIKLFKKCDVEKYVEYYYTKGGDKYYYSLDSKNPSKDVFTSRNLTFLVHGFGHDFELNGTDWMVPMGMKIADVTDGVSILVNYQRLSFCRYDYLATNVIPLLGESLSVFIKKLNRPLDTITIVGHSLGAHIAGITGTNLNGKIGQIIGLEPAGILYRFNGRGLNKKCAKYVQVLHTTWLIGKLVSLGHTDYYGNPSAWNFEQTGCLLSECSHKMAVKFFDASLFFEYPFYGIGCRGTDPSEVSRFGIYSDDRKQGSFCFDTTECFPYTKTFSKPLKIEEDI